MLRALPRESSSESSLANQLLRAHGVHDDDILGNRIMMILLISSPVVGYPGSCLLLLLVEEGNDFVVLYLTSNHPSGTYVGVVPVKVGLMRIQTNIPSFIQSHAPSCLQQDYRSRGVEIYYSSCYVIRLVIIAVVFVIVVGDGNFLQRGGFIERMIDAF